MAQIYFISNENGAIKIGISNGVLGRLTTLQTASPTKLVLLGAFDGNEFEERERHYILDVLFGSFRKIPTGRHEGGLDVCNGELFPEASQT